MKRSSRIWELDALRGFCILGVVLIHLLYDLQVLFSIPVHSGPLLRFVQRYGGTVFVVLSGLCVTLGSHSLRRGLILLACGMGITLVTALLTAAGFSYILIRFGILHLLGTCMVLWPLFRKLPTTALAALGVVLTAVGYRFTRMTVSVPWLFPLGLPAADFYSADYFPLLPYFGWFLLGAVLGRLLYRDRTTLFPGHTENLLPVRFFRRCGQHSLAIYLVHQPILLGLLLLIL